MTDPRDELVRQVLRREAERLDAAVPAARAPFVASRRRHLVARRTVAAVVALAAIATATVVWRLDRRPEVVAGPSPAAAPCDRAPSGATDARSSAFAVETADAHGSTGAGRRPSSIAQWLADSLVVVARAEPGAVADAEHRVLRATFDIDCVLGGGASSEHAAGDRVEVELALAGTSPAAASSLAELGAVVLALQPLPDGGWRVSPTAWRLATIDRQGRLDLPALDPASAAELLRPLPTLDSLAEAARRAAAGSPDDESPCTATSAAPANEPYVALFAASREFLSSGPGALGVAPLSERIGDPATAIVVAHAIGSGAPDDTTIRAAFAVDCTLQSRTPLPGILDVTVEGISGEAVDSIDLGALGSVLLLLRLDASTGTWRVPGFEVLAIAPDGGVQVRPPLGPLWLGGAVTLADVERLADGDAVDLDAPAGVALWTVDMVDESTVYAGGPDRVLRSDDGGRTWTGQALLCSSCPGELRVADIDMVDSNLGWAATSLGLFHTIDGGTWFDQWTGADHEPAEVDFLSADDGWMLTAPWGAGESVGLDDAALSRTVDGGLTWTPLETPSGAQSMCFTSSGGWLATRTAIFRTDDGGGSWAERFSFPGSPTPFSTVSIGCSESGGAWAIFRTSLSAALVATTSARDEWRQVDDVAGTATGPAIADRNAYVVRDAAGVVVGEELDEVNDSDSPVRIADGRAFTALDASFADGRHAVVVGDARSGPTVFRSDDAGATWSPVFVSETSQLYEDSCPRGETTETYDSSQGRYFVRAVDIDPASGALSFDLLQHLEGEDAVAAYLADGGSAGGLVEGGYDVNRSSDIAQAPVDVSARIRLHRLAQTGSAAVQPATLADLVAYIGDPTSGAASFAVWLTIRDGVIVDVCEQYHP